MTIEFAPERWKRIREDYRRWWAVELERPLIQMTLTGCAPGRAEPKLPLHGFASSYDFSVSADEIIDRWDWEISRREYLGDAFPCFWPNFGPGSMASFLGAEVTPHEDTTWFHPKGEAEIADIHFRYDPKNPWLERTKDVCRAAGERWQGQVQVHMPDLGGSLDILSTFRPGEQLLLDLYDHPDDVKRLTWEAHDLWWQYFEEIDAVLRPANPGYTAWAPIFSETPYYMLQCDFCYMIGPEMFDEFVKPELAATCNRLSNAFYHLDGPGQLAHLDSLLEIESLKGIQWIPGSGAKPQSQWTQVYQKIRNAGKLIQVYAYSDGNTAALDFHWLDTLVEQLGSQEGIIMLSATAPMARKDEALEVLAKHGAA